MRTRFDEVNAKGGIHGRKLRLVVEDHGYAVPRVCRRPTNSSTTTRSSSCKGALGTPHNNAAFAEQLPKGVPNLFPFTAAR